MACEFFGISPSLWSVAGLIADFAGVTLLGFDLVRLQRLFRSRARDNLNYFEGMASEYGGIESWAVHIQKQANWVPARSYSDYHSDDEVSFNTRKAIEAINELSSCLNGLAEQISKVMLVQNNQAQHDAAAARTSVRFSVIGLSVIAIGFALQIVGAWPC